MTLPILSNWDDTKAALHQSLQILRSTRLLGIDPMPSELEYSVIPTPYGATTGPLRFGGVLRLDYARGEIVYVKDGIEVFAIGLNGQHQTSLFDAVFDAFRQSGLYLEPNRNKITEITPFNLNLQQAKTYAEVQWRMHNVLARLKARMYGPQTPVALWPHGFDLSTIWFVAGMDEHKDPQMNFGFSPGTPDVGQPYFYFYAWPVPDGFAEKLPSVVQWNASWSTPGGVIKYDRFARNPDPEGLVSGALIQAWLVGSEMLKANAAQMN